jgi:hypothetical protein
MAIFDFLRKKEELTEKSEVSTVYHVPTSDGSSFLTNDHRYAERANCSFENSLIEKYMVDKKEKAQGGYQRFGYGATIHKLQKHQIKIGTTPDGKTVFRYLTEEGNYKNGYKDGVVRFYEKDGSIADHYTVFKEGRLVDSSDKTEGLKYQKEVDKEARQSTLKALLKANSREEKLDILDKFHSEKAPVPRRSSSPIDRAMTLNKLKGGPDMDV